MTTSFTSSAVWGILPLQVTFTNTSDPVSSTSNWDFGDGSGPQGGLTTQHIFATPGNFTVTLSTETGTAQATITVQEPYTVTFGPSTLSIPMRKIDDDDYASIGLRGLQSTFPTVWYDDGKFPLRTLSFWPVPAQAWAVELWLWEPLGQNVDLDAELNLPPGYERYLRYKLALELAPEFGKTTPPEVVNSLAEAESNVKRLNIQTPLAHPSSLARASQGRSATPGTGVIDSVAFRSGGWMLGRN